MKCYFRSFVTQQNNSYHYSSGDRNALSYAHRIKVKCRKIERMMPKLNMMAEGGGEDEMMFLGRSVGGDGTVGYEQLQ